MRPFVWENFQPQKPLKIKLETKILYSCIYLHTYTHIKRFTLIVYSIKYSFDFFLPMIQCSSGLLWNMHTWYCFGRRKIGVEIQCLRNFEAVRLCILQSKRVCVCEKLFIVTARSIVDWIRDWMSLLNSPAMSIPSSSMCWRGSNETFIRRLFVPRQPFHLVRRANTSAQCEILSSAHIYAKFDSM